MTIPALTRSEAKIRRSLVRTWTATPMPPSHTAPSNPARPHTAKQIAHPANSNESRATCHGSRPNMQNKPNFQKAQMNLKLYSTKDYEKEPRLPITEKQTQSNPISKANKASCGSPSPAGGALLIDKPLLNTDEGQEDKAIAKSADHALASLGGGWICNLRRTVDQLVVRDYHFSIMAKIIYGVAGEGFGHSSRSHLIGQRLIDAGHDVMFVGYDKSLRYLKQYFGERVRQIFGLSFAYEDGRIDKSETLKLNLLNLSEGNRQNDELFKKYFEPFGPDLVISDFEPFSAWWAWRNQVPFISTGFRG
jgi:hypothetical protein